MLAWLQMQGALLGSSLYCGYSFPHPATDDNFAPHYTPFDKLPTSVSNASPLVPGAPVPSGDVLGSTYSSALGIPTVSDVRAYVGGVPSSGDPLSASFVNDALDRLEGLGRFLLSVDSLAASTVPSRSETRVHRGTTGVSFSPTQVGEPVCTGASPGDPGYNCASVSRECSRPVLSVASCAPSGLFDGSGPETSGQLLYVRYAYYAGKQSGASSAQTYSSETGAECYTNYRLVSVSRTRYDFASAAYGNVNSVAFLPPPVVEIPLVASWPPCAPVPTLVAAWLGLSGVTVSAARTWEASQVRYHRADGSTSWSRSSSVPESERPFADEDLSFASSGSMLVRVQGTLAVSGGALVLSVPGGAELADRVVAAASGSAMPSWASKCFGDASETDSPAVVADDPDASATELPAAVLAQSGFKIVRTEVDGGHVDVSVSGPTEYYVGHVNVSAAVRAEAALQGAVVVVERPEESDGEGSD